MRSIIASIAFLSFIATPTLVFAQRDWPTAAAIEKAAARAKYDREETETTRYRGKEVKFVPCNVSEMSDQEMARGFILGELVSQGPSPENLPAGNYIVFLHRRGNDWEAFFCKSRQAVAKSARVAGHLEKERRPSFVGDNKAIRYWHWRVGW